MKVLWLCNMAMPKALKEINRIPENTGSWLVAQEEELQKEDIELIICSLDYKAVEITKVIIGKNTHYLIPTKDMVAECFDKILKEENPQLIHIFGTEYNHTQEMMKVADKKKVLITVQGVMHKCAENYNLGVDKKYLKHAKLKTIINNTINSLGKTVNFMVCEKERFEKMGNKEKEILLKGKYFSGRTDFDKKAIFSINKNAEYFHINESLRKEFYDGSIWQYKNCKKHSIFISQASYPLKGFSVFLRALEIVVKKYPDTKVIVGGKTLFINDFSKIKEKIVFSFYDYYQMIAKILKEKDLKKHIEFKGDLSSNQMKEEYLNANVYLLSSSVENSPNSLGESMMLGTPIITTLVGGINSVFDAQKDGLTYDFLDYKTLAKAIISVFEEEERAQSYQKYSIEHAKQLFDKEKNSKDLIYAYKEIIGRN